MQTKFLIALGIIFIGTFCSAMFLLYLFSANPLKERLKTALDKGTKSEAKQEKSWVAKIAKITSPLAKLSIPKEGWDKSALRVRFMNAGFRSEHATAIYFGTKTLLAIVSPIVAWVVITLSFPDLKIGTQVFAVVIASAVGFYFPNFILARRIAARQLTIFENFPDSLDLMTICIEAGLAIDAAVARVASEIADVSPELSEEMYIVTLELRAGNSKERALRNLAMRTGVEEVDTLVAMLIQAERFGTSIADSLRIHADGLRIKRHQRAEESAAKIPLKLLFPLIFCIFPALMVTLIGPAVIQISRTLFPALGGQ